MKSENQPVWYKGTNVNEAVERFTVGLDREMDMYLAQFDVMGTMAHIRMLEHIGLLTGEELHALEEELRVIYQRISDNDFCIEDGAEDVHSQAELMLTRKLGDAGKKVHSGRSRNDQVLVDIKLFVRHEIEEIVQGVGHLFDVLMAQSERYKNVLMPGYTHLQVAMPSSFGLWFGAYAESLTDDLRLMQAAWQIANQNPLGSAAGYGSSFPLNRTMTAQLLGFDDLNYNVVYAQMGRGKTEKTVAFAMASIAATLARFSMDACLYMSQNFGFISLPDELTTGSSIMPHKKNPDVFELIRAKCNRIQALPTDITLLVNNLPSGYFRDMQILKEILFPAFAEMKNCIGMLAYMAEQITVNRDILDDDRYRYLFSVEALNELVLGGAPFRDAYRQVGMEIGEGRFHPVKRTEHTHEGSIGNLCNDQIQEKMKAILRGFTFDKVNRALAELMQQPGESTLRNTCQPQ
ncbi:MAG: argininosuccinate lyase [Bacteroidales bacterium]|jgi:argininosuccinate lyase|nr:argininosuccinate lyase [Bacteroidales bacterium]